MPLKHKIKNIFPSFKVPESLSLKYSKYIYAFLISIIIISFILRFLFFNQNPPALNQDEAMNGFNAYSISKTLRDSRGVFLPVKMHAYTEKGSVLPVYTYLTVPFVAVFGLNETSTRLPALIVNIGLIVLIFFLVKHLFSNGFIALLASLLVSLNPWCFHYSRVAHEGVLQPFFFLLPIFLSIFALTNKKYKYLFPVVGIFFGISFYTYQIAYLVIPVIILILFILYNREIFDNYLYFILAAIIALIIVYPLIFDTLVSTFQYEKKYSMVLIFGEKNPLKLFINNYLSYFSPVFLFLKGDVENLTGTGGAYGMFHKYIIIFLPLGLIFLFYHLFSSPKYRRSILLVLILFFLYPVGAAFSKDIPHALRAYALVPLFQIISACGIWAVIQIVLKTSIGHKPMVTLIIKSFSLCFTLFLLFYYFIIFLYNYYYIYPNKSALLNYYNYGTKEFGTYIKQHQSEYDTIYITSEINQPFIYVLFYGEYDPEIFHNTTKRMSFRLWINLYQFDKYFFIPNSEMPLVSEKALYVTRGRYTLANKTLLKNVRDPENNIKFSFWK